MTPPLLDRLQRAIGDSYRIEREIGAGGMATVFAAVETSLGRRVAVKVLKSELVAELSIDRFAREVRLAASLQQANIVPLLSAGSADGFSYYTMPLIDGSSLRARMASGVPVPLSEATSILRDVARALAYAHAAGVVHRDIKPDNVLLSGGTAVVSDFGIAKAMHAARTGNLSTITGAGLSLGTPAYMAPEQILGEDIDARADIYAWGVLAWELIAGRHPFASRTTPQSVLAAHLTAVPPPLESQGGVVPARLAALVMSCLQKEPDRRPRSAAEVLDVLDAVATPTSAADAGPVRPGRRVAFVAGGAMVAAALIALFVLRPDAPPASAAADEPLSVAVLPFEIIGGDTAQEYFADGLTDELATALGRVAGVRVAARSATYQYKDRRDIDVREVGAALGVRYLLVGSVRRTGSQFRLSAQLTGAADALEIWSDSYSRPANDLLAVQDSLTAAITSALAQRLGARSRTDPTAAMTKRRGTSSYEAYDLFLKGQYFLTRRRPGLEGAVRSFEAATGRDDRFARAYAGLANALALLTYYGERPLEEARVVEYARRALTLDSTQADAHIALGIMHMSVGRLAVAEEALRAAIALEPTNTAAYFQLGRCLTYFGRLDEAAQTFERAKSLEPFAAATATWLAYVLTHQALPERALAEARRAWELDSSSAVVQLFSVLTADDAHRTADAARFMRHSPQRNVLTRGAFAYVLGRIDSPDSSRAVIAEIEARGAARWNDYTNLAFAALGVPDTALALSAIERSVARNEPFAGFIPLWSRMFDGVRQDPRFVAIAERSGIRMPPTRAQ